jgi:hypothetical protein
MSFGFKELRFDDYSVTFYVNCGEITIFFQVYPMSSYPRGYFFMINNVQFVNDIEDARVGSQVDEKNLGDLFRDFGYIVESYRDQGLEVDVSAITCKLQYVLSLKSQVLIKHHTLNMYGMEV